jgi:hypothetical protein
MPKVKNSKTQKSDLIISANILVDKNSEAEEKQESELPQKQEVEVEVEVEQKQKQKRGRKTKNEMVEIKKQKLNQPSTTINEISLNINESNLISNNLINDSESDNDNDNDTEESNTILSSSPSAKSSIKKRGRKPKGGKIVQQITPINSNKESKPNIILHLKCSLKDLINNSAINSTIESFDFSLCKGNELTYEIINKQEKVNNYSYNNEVEINKPVTTEEDIYDYDDNSNSNINTNTNNNIKEIWKKLKQLEYNLHINNISNKKSSCFWCTCDFDNPPVYIPKHFIKGTYQVYGCFCSPECSTAFLMDENIDSSIKFERYHLLNHIYAKIYNYTINIKPAPNPYYMLDKYYGNLNIQEYRALLNNQRLFLIVDKPLTRILPELHEDNDDFIINNKIIPSNTYQIKKNIQKKNQSKNNIVNEKFGLIQQ